MEEAAGKIYNMQKSILITGASTGIGRGLAFEFSSRGYALGVGASRMVVKVAVTLAAPLASAA